MWLSMLQDCALGLNRHFASNGSNLGSCIVYLNILYTLISLAPSFHVILAGGRHWKEVMRISGHELDLTPETFKLQQLLNAKLLSHKDEVCAVHHSAFNC